MGPCVFWNCPGYFYYSLYCRMSFKQGVGVAWDLSLARAFCFMPNAVLVVVKGPVVSGARAVAEKPCDFGKSRIVLVDKDRMDL